MYALVCDLTNMTSEQSHRSLMDRDKDNKIGKDGKTFGARVRDLRDHMKMTQQELADLVGIDRGTLIRIESDKRYPQSATIEALAAALDVSPTALISGRGVILSSQPEIIDQRDLFDHAERITNNLGGAVGGELYKALLNILATYAGSENKQLASRTFFDFACLEVFVAMKTTTKTPQEMAEFFGIDFDQLIARWDDLVSNQKAKA